MKGSKYNDEVREQALAMIASGLTVSQVAKIMDIPRTTVSCWNHSAEEDDEDFLAFRSEQRRKMIRKCWKVVDRGIQGMDRQMADALREKKEISFVIAQILQSGEIDDRTRKKMAEIIASYSGVGLTALTKATKDAFEIHQALNAKENEAGKANNLESCLAQLDASGEGYDY